MNDVIIVGAGISGLYSAFQIKKNSPEMSILILEANNKIGGRMDKEKFHGIPINTGAGIGRKKDTLLINLLSELNIEFKEFEVKIDYSDKIDKIINLDKISKLLKRKYTKNKYGKKTFYEFATLILGTEIYEKYVEKLGFSDFEREDANEVLNNYELEDNEGGWTGLSIDWNLLISKLAQQIGHRNIKFNVSVEKISNFNENFVVSTSQNNYFAKNIVVATDICSLARLFPTFRIYDQIQGQPFLRVYAKFEKLIPVQNTTVVSGPLQKVSLINAKEKIYQIAYSDNAAAIFLKPFIKNTLKNRQFFSILVAKALSIEPVKITDIKSYYWENGTHFYSPLNREYKNRDEYIQIAQHPAKNIAVVGEMISKNQGWSNSALQSVISALKFD